MLSDGAANALEQINRQIEEKKQSIISLKNEFDKAANAIFVRIRAWRCRTESLRQKLASLNISLLDAALASRTEDISAAGGVLLKSIADSAVIDHGSESVDADVVTGFGEDGLKELSAAADNLRTQANVLDSRLSDEQKALAIQRSELAAVRESLEGGIYPFPKDAMDLKDALISRLRTAARREVNVRIVAEAAEIKNERWRNAVEGYLYTQRYYIIVPQEYFKEALRVFDAIKRNKAVYSTGLVDIEKLKKINPAADAGSLAEELETSDADVRLFLDYTLGRVQKCENVLGLRRYRTSITNDGVLYQNFVVRAMNPERWAKPAIGQGAIQKRLDAVKSEIERLMEQIAACSGVKTAIGNITGLEILSSSEIEQAVQSAEKTALIPSLEFELDSLIKNRAAIDTTSIEILKKRIAVPGNDIDTQTRHIDDANDSKGTFKERRRQLRDERIPLYTEDLRYMEANITERYNDLWIDKTGAPR
ncbi:MAG: hypothetical protein LBB94_01165, partial [Clostridiales bacterium]|nr:hypothetical protein [Clostridiales bacterium]